MSVQIGGNSTTDDSDGDALIDFYVGETDDFSTRLADHIRTKDWWKRFVVFVSKDHNLTKAHVKYLEGEIYLIAKENLTTLRLRNDKEPGGTRLPESDLSAMREFLDNMRFVLEALGLSYFPTQRSAVTNPGGSGAAPRANEAATAFNGAEFSITLTREASGGDSQRSFMRIEHGMYVLKAGSYITKTARDSFEEMARSYHALWKQIIKSDAVQKSDFDGLLKTTRDLEFRSASAASAVVLARSANGRTEWKRVSDGTPLAKCLTDLDVEDAS